jgi:hypothetical protein
MKNEKTLVLLRSLSRKELSDFRDFVHSPYFNKNGRITDFADYLYGFAPDFEEVCLALEQIPQHLGNQGPMDKKALSYLKSGLLKLLRSFLGYENIRTTPHFLTYYTALGLLEKRNEHALTLLEKLKAELDQGTGSGHQAILLQYLTNDLLHSLKANDKLTAESLLQESINKLEQYYLVNKLSYSCEIENRSLILRQAFDFDNPLMKPIEEMLESKENLDPLIALYFQLYLTTKYDREEKYFHQLKDRLQHPDNRFIDPAEFRGIYLATINISLRKMRENPDKFRAICLELYEKGIESKVLFENGRLSEWTYQNTIKLALRLQRYSWTEQFIYRYNDYLEQSAKRNARYSNLAELAFCQKDYDLTFEHLNHIDTSHFKYFISTKILLIKAFYETGNLDSCQSNLGSFTVYLSRRKDVTKAHKKGYQHFCQLLHRTLLHRNSKQQLKIKQQITTLTPLAEREWLMEVFKKENPRFQ